VVVVVLGTIVMVSHCRCRYSVVVVVVVAMTIVAKKAAMLE
jgi:hypothetical protein